MIAEGAQSTITGFAFDHMLKVTHCLLALDHMLKVTHRSLVLAVSVANVVLRGISDNISV